MNFTFPPWYSAVLSLLPCLIPPYALRLNRVFGTKRIGWVLFVVFSLLAALQLVRAWRPMGLALDPGVGLDLLNLMVPMLLMISLFHIESIFRERLRLEAEEKKLREELEIKVQQRTAALDVANQELQREILMRRQGEDQLLKSKEQYRFLFDENPQPMWIYDRDTFRFLAFNTAALRHYGFTGAEFRELTVTDLCLPDQTDAFVADAAKDAPAGSRRSLWHHRKKEGAVVQVETIGMDLNYDGRSARLVLVHDLSTERQLQTESQQTQKIQATSQVAGGVAERFSRLLAGIESDANSLAQDSANAVTAERLKRLATTAGNASSLTRQLVALVTRQATAPTSLAS